MAGAAAQSVVEDDGGAGELGGGDTAVHWAAAGYEALLAGADGVTLVVDHTAGQLPAWGGVAGGPGVLDVSVVS